jgi:hypothetical protein
MVNLTNEPWASQAPTSPTRPARDAASAATPKNSRQRQRAKILKLLRDACGDWVPQPRIAALAAQYNSRILELRRLGFRIPPPRTETVNGRCHTWYRLESGPAEQPPGPVVPADDPPLESTLFPTNAPQRWVATEERSR